MAISPSLTTPLRSILLACMFVLPCPLAAEVIGRALAVESYGLDSGLAQSSVLSFAEDDSGFLWFGTQEGLHRFDGHRFTVLQRVPGNQDSLISSTADELAVDSQGRLWIGSNDAGLEVVDLATLQRWRFDTRDGLAHNRVIDLAFETSGSAAWVATAAGIDRVDLSQRTVQRATEHEALIGLVTSEDEQWLAADRRCRLVSAAGVAGIDGMQGQVCVALVQDPQGAVWMASENGPLVRIDRQSTPQLEVYPRPPGLQAPLTALYARTNGGLLFGDSRGNVIEWHASEPETAIRWDIDIGDSAVLGFFRNSAGVLWIGTYTNGLHRVLPLSERVIASGMLQSQGRAWPSESVRAMHRYSDRWLVGTDSGLMTFEDQEWRRFDELSGIPVRRILASRHDGGYWLGTHQGLWFWRPGEPPSLIADSSLPDQRITDLALHQRTLWVATRSGMAAFQNGRQRDDLVPSIFQQRFLTTITVDASGVVWVGSNEDGVFRFQPGEPVEHIFTGDSNLATESVWAIHVGSPHTWLGTFGGGLVAIDDQGEIQRQLTRQQGLPNNVVYRILSDQRGRLWLSTNRGLGVVDIDTGQVQQLGARDGLRNQEFNAGAAWADPSGRFYFGGVRGIDAVNPEAFTLSSPPARPVITDLTISHRQVGMLERIAGLDGALAKADSLELDYRQRIFSLRMVALDFNAPSAAQLRYRVEGLDDDWVEVNSPEATFSVNYLAPGRYRLLIQAAGRDGRFSQQRQLQLILQPPPWRQPWAIAVYLVLGTLLLLAGIWQARRSMYRKRRQVERLHRLVAERTADLERLNQQLTRSNDRLDLANRRDPLTGASNRRDFLDWMAHEQHRTSDSSPPLLFFMIDIDDFKAINDQHGHSIGDRVLVAFSSRLKAFCREHDLLVRWGGEEFLLVADNIEPRKAADLAGRIVHAVANQKLIEEPLSLSVTCSIGFAPWPFDTRAHSNQSWEQSVELADRALYRAKATGKNGWIGILPGPNWRPDSALADKPLQQLSESGQIECLGSVKPQPDFD